VTAGYVTLLDGMFDVKATFIAGLARDAHLGCICHLLVGARGPIRR